MEIQFNTDNKKKYKIIDNTLDLIDSIKEETKEEYKPDLSTYRGVNENDFLFNKDPRNPIYTKDDLTDDGLPSVEAQMREMKRVDEINKKELDLRREMVTMIKSISLVKMGKEPLVNTSYLSYPEKSTLIKIMNEYANESQENIREEFNRMCSEKIFNPNCDYSKLPVYNV